MKSQFVFFILIFVFLLSACKPAPQDRRVVAEKEVELAVDMAFYSDESRNSDTEPKEINLRFGEYFGDQFMEMLGEDTLLFEDVMEPRLQLKFYRSSVDEPDANHGIAFSIAAEDGFFRTVERIVQRGDTLRLVLTGPSIVVQEYEE